MFLDWIPILAELFCIGPLVTSRIPDNPVWIVKPSKAIPKQWTTIKHHQTPSNTIKHHQTSSNTIKHKGKSKFWDVSQSHCFHWVTLQQILLYRQDKMSRGRHDDESSQLVDTCRHTISIYIIYIYIQLYIIIMLVKHGKTITLDV